MNTINYTIKRIIYGREKRLQVIITDNNDIIVTNCDNQHIIPTIGLEIKTICVLYEHIVILYINNSLAVYKIVGKNSTLVYTYNTNKLFTRMDIYAIKERIRYSKYIKNDIKHLIEEDCFYIIGDCSITRVLLDNTNITQQKIYIKELEYGYIKYIKLTYFSVIILENKIKVHHDIQPLNIINSKKNNYFNIVNDELMYNGNSIKNIDIKKIIYNSNQLYILLNNGNNACLEYYTISLNRKILEISLFCNICDKNECDKIDKINDIYCIDHDTCICKIDNKIFEHTDISLGFYPCKYKEIHSYNIKNSYSMYNFPLKWTFNIHKYIDQPNFRNNIYQLVTCIMINKLPICKNILWLIIRDIYRYYNVIIN